MITENCNNNRIKLKNEIQKIKTYFDNKIIDSNKLMDLLNLQENENFNNVKDSALTVKTKHKSIIKYYNYRIRKIDTLCNIYLSKTN